MSQAVNSHAWPPRRMNAVAAAYHLGVSTTKFHVRVKEGVYPPPIKDGGNKLWDRVVLDRMVDAQSGISSDLESWD